MCNVNIELMCPECFKINTVKLRGLSDDKTTCLKFIRNLIYDENSLFYSYTKCDCCNITMFIIDNTISHIIQMLNIKGYLTSFCCEGHGRKSKPYISFKTGVVTKDEILEYIGDAGDMWCVEEHTRDWETAPHTVIRVIRSLYIQNYDSDVFKSLYLDKLSKWVERLPWKLGDGHNGNNQ